MFEIVEMNLKVRRYSIKSTTYDFLLVTFRVSRRPREMYCGHARLCVCVSVCARPHAYTIARTRM